ncbi:hypothetical protein SHAb15599_00050 [Acinetobacter phage SH-Ab 15599]|nr:hypothetical protein SHAb15599_00050 [Acinetobacter phage SH-Ab 15599]
MSWYHITPLENLDSILQFGLILHAVPNTSDNHDPLGHYVSDDWVQLLISDTYPEIFKYDEIAILLVDISDYQTMDDPEYSSIKSDDDFQVQVVLSNVKAKDIELLCTVDFSEIDFNIYSNKRLKEFLEYKEAQSA